MGFGQFAIFSLLLLVAFAVGNGVGRTTEARRWRYSATSLYRIESAGRLYEVTRAKESE